MFGREEEDDGEHEINGDGLPVGGSSRSASKVGVVEPHLLVGLDKGHYNSLFSSILSPENPTVIRAH